MTDDERHVSPLVAAIRADDIAEVQRALAIGENPRLLYDGETPLHTAVRGGSIEIVEALIAGGALEWVPDAAGRTPLDVARTMGRETDDAIVALLDRQAITDPSFRAAVAAIHSGDIATLTQLLDAEPRLLTARNLGADVYRKRARPDYFRDPKLFWYVANNPTTVNVMPENITEIAQTMIARGIEQADLDYTLALVMSSGVAEAQGLQVPLMHTLLSAGAVTTREALVVAAAHRQLDALRALVGSVYALDAPISAALGDTEKLRALLPGANTEDIALAFGLAVINNHVDAVRAALAAGADVDGFLPVHAHSTALHNAAGNDDVPMIEALLEAGARTDIRDTLWDGTPMEWATFGKRTAAIAALQRR